jgi:hypothetical protein
VLFVIFVASLIFACVVALVLWAAGQRNVF